MMYIKNTIYNVFIMIIILILFIERIKVAKYTVFYGENIVTCHNAHLI